jgi:hypothetical protein
MTTKPKCRCRGICRVCWGNGVAIDWFGEREGNVCPHCHGTGTCGYRAATEPARMVS